MTLCLNVLFATRRIAVGMPHAGIVTVLPTLNFMWFLYTALIRASPLCATCPTKEKFKHIPESSNKAHSLNFLSR
jgi:hypothetical protein